MHPGTGRPTTRSMAGGAGVLNSQIRVADRPVTQQGLRGIKTGSKGPNRQVQDRSYFMGLLRGKIQELSHEIQAMNQSVEIFNQENATFLTFEKRAEVLASQIKELQGEMADYNTLMDKLNTDTEMDAVLADLEVLNKRNEQESQDIDEIFASKQEKEKELEKCTAVLERKKKVIGEIIGNMDPSVRERYQSLTAENEKIKGDLLEQQNTLDALTSKASKLQEEIAQSAIKKEAFQLHQQLSEVAASLEEWKKAASETPQQAQERLLRQVKDDNQEMSSIDKKTSELKNQLASVQEQLQQVTTDLTHLHGERKEKYLELKRREESMREYLDAFEKSKADELEKIGILEQNIVIVLEHISRSMSHFEHMPTTDEFKGLQDNLAFKKAEKEKSEATAKTLDEKSFKFQADLKKVEDLEKKINSELDQLKSEIETMNKEVVVFADLEGLQASETKKAQQLSEEKKTLLHRRDESQKTTKFLTKRFEDAKTSLSDNDTFSQLGNLERKWQHHEQNNFVMREYITARQAEANFQQVSLEVWSLIREYNHLLCQTLSGASTSY